jgi:hydroxymethylglutaryl-CoA lyase
MKREFDVLVHEVGTRDGLQSIDTIFTTEGKMEWIRREAAAGVPQIQVGSFIPPKLLPQLADTPDVVRQSLQIPDLIVSALVPNLKGAENAMIAGAHQVGVVLSVSEAHNQSNVRRSTQDSIDDFGRIVEHRNANSDYKNIVVSGGMATAFGCTISGSVPVADVMRVAEGLVERGADRLNVSDTVGYANPGQVRALFEELYRTVGTYIPVGAHFHDTRGLGLANVFAALDAGVREFDACLGGLGGCPYAPGASGNIVTEDLVFLLESLGLKTGVDLDGLLEAREIMERQLNGEPVQGTFVNAGLPKGFVDAA